jgi:hypothetical protein
VLTVEISRHGGPEELVLIERPDPMAAGRGSCATGGSGSTTSIEMSLDMLATRGTLVLYDQSAGAGRGASSLSLRWVAASHYLTSQHDREDPARGVTGGVAGHCAAGLRPAGGPAGCPPAWGAVPDSGVVSRYLTS